MRVAALVPAGGEGRRLHVSGQPSKQFREIGGEPLLVHVLRALAAHAWVREIVVAVPQEESPSWSEIIASLDLGARVRVGAGGSTRRRSVERALSEIDGTENLVAVHDAVRPFLAFDRLDAVLRAAARAGAAALAIPVSDTLRRVEHPHFRDPIDRTGLWRMQTPQVFRPELLAAAFDAFPDLEATDEVTLVRQLGHDVEVVPGGSANFKITTPSDWELARLVWPAWQELQSHRE